MQKKIIALAIAGLASTAAFAQSNVTIYGIADAYVGQFKSDTVRTAVKVNSGGLSGSRLGFKGVEDLGNGLKAVFALEYALAIDADQGAIAATAGTTTTTTTGGVGVAGTNGSGIGAARQQYVGLTGGFGTAVAGRLQTTGYDWGVKYDVLAGTAISSLQNVVSTTFNIGATAGHARANNAIAYISPSFGGVTLAANYAYAAEESALKTAAAANKTTATLLSATYANGPLSVGVAYDRVGADSSIAADGVRDLALGASYDFKVVKAFATYQTTKDNNAAGILGDTNKAWSAGVAVPVSAAGTVIASYAKNTIDSTAADDDKKSYTLAYTHGLSKRTTAYAGYYKINSEATNGDSSALVSGVRHSF